MGSHGPGRYGPGSYRGFDYRWVFTYPYRDPRIAIRFLVGSFFAWFPIANLMAFGYAVRTARRVMRGDARPMPGWRAEFGGILGDGIKMYVLVFVYFVLTAFVAMVLLTVMGTLVHGGGWTDDFLLMSITHAVLLMLAIVLLPIVVLQVAASDRLRDLFRLRDFVGAISYSLRATGQMLLVVAPVLSGMALFLALAGRAPPLYLLVGPLGFACCLVLGGAVGQAGRIMEIGGGAPFAAAGFRGGFQTPPPPPPPPPSSPVTLPTPPNRKRLSR